MPERKPLSLQLAEVEREARRLAAVAVFCSPLVAKLEQDARSLLGRLTPEALSALAAEAEREGTGPVFARQVAEGIVDALLHAARTHVSGAREQQARLEGRADRIREEMTELEVVVSNGEHAPMA